LDDERFARQVDAAEVWRLLEAERGHPAMMHTKG
jgi:hypothetical protein